MKIEYSKQFRKDIKKLSNKDLIKFKQRFDLFQEQPNHPELRSHKLKGALDDYWSFNVDGDLRVQYRIEKYQHKADVLRLVRIGSHSELYG